MGLIPHYHTHAPSSTQPPCPCRPQLSALCQTTQPEVRGTYPTPSPPRSFPQHTRTCSGVDAEVSTRAASRWMPMITPAVLMSSCTRSCSANSPSVSTPVLGPSDSVRSLHGVGGGARQGQRQGSH